MTDTLADQPALRVLSLGAGVQSTTLALLSAEGRLPKLDAAIFADTGWEPKAVYAHLNRLEREVLIPAGIPLHRVTRGNIRNDALDPAHRFASMPLFIKNRDGGDGMTRRQCSNEYKVVAIKAKARQLLGYPHPTPVPRGRYAEQWIGISRDEIGCAKDSDVKYARNAFPLLDLDGAADGRGGGGPGMTVCGTCARPAGSPRRSPRASAARSTATGSGGTCGTTTRRSGRTPSTSTTRSGPGMPAATPTASRSSARRTCTPPACRSTKRRSTV